MAQSDMTLVPWATVARLRRERKLKEQEAMPLRAGKSKKVVSDNISEFHSGKTYAKTKAKFGKAKADKQAVAIAMSKKRKS